MLALRADALPDEVRNELDRLFDAAPAVPFESVRAQIERALGPLDRHFRSVDPVPLGTASVAQVHRARLRDGTPVAVKVRLPELSPRELKGDLRALR
ncbi:MAG: AarF/UbiB family protein, partial [Candidatus Rokuibacteriota bacterium]